MQHVDIEAAVLRALNPAQITADLSCIVQIPSITGAERDVLERLGELAAASGLAATIHQHDLEVLRSHPGYPGEEVHRDELVGLSAVLTGNSPDAPRICLNGHLDVVDPGTLPWEYDPWSGPWRMAWWMAGGPST